MLFLTTFILCCSLQVLSSFAQESANKGIQCSGVPGIPGSPGATGSTGSPGRDGREGRDGQKGEKGDMGLNWQSGIPGIKGRAGVIGPAGMKGAPGEKGNSGKTGPQGLKGLQGLRGSKGGKGAVGRKGEKGDKTEHLNWKQCVWKRVDPKDSGLIQECRFTKRHGNTALHVAYAGNLRTSGSRQCSRWYFTFNNAECTGPMTIEGLVYTTASENEHRHRQIEGFCDNLAAGEVLVRFHIGKCNGKSLSDGDTGWNSVSRIMIQEVPPAQQSN